MTTTTTTASSIIGYKVGSYKIGTKIGSGSFGEIHKGKKEKKSIIIIIYLPRDKNRYRRKIRRRSSDKIRKSYS